MKNKKLFGDLPFLLVLTVGTVAILRRQGSIPYQNNKGMVFGTSFN